MREYQYSLTRILAYTEYGKTRVIGKHVYWDIENSDGHINGLINALQKSCFENVWKIQWNAALQLLKNYFPFWVFSTEIPKIFQSRSNSTQQKEFPSKSKQQASFKWCIFFIMLTLLRMEKRVNIKLKLW